MFPLLEVPVTPCYFPLLKPHSSVFKTILQEPHWGIARTTKRYHLYKGEGHGTLGQAQGEGLGNSISIAGVGHVISSPQFEIPAPLPPC